MKRKFVVKPLNNKKVKVKEGKEFFSPPYYYGPPEEHTISFQTSRKGSLVTANRFGGGRGSRGR